MIFTFKDIKYKVDWEHFQQLNVNIKKNPKVVRKTVCKIMIYGKDNVVASAEVKCSPKDPYVKDIGRRRSLAKALAEFHIHYGSDREYRRSFIKEVFEIYNNRTNNNNANNSFVFYRPT